MILNFRTFTQNSVTPLTHPHFPTTTANEPKRLTAGYTTNHWWMLWPLAPSSTSDHQQCSSTPNHSYSLMLRSKLDCRPHNWPLMDIGHLLGERPSTTQLCSSSQLRLLDFATYAWMVDHKLEQPALAPTCLILLRCFTFDFFTKCFWCGPRGSFFEFNVLFVCQ
jgi:hypothetical protein